MWHTLEQKQHSAASAAQAGFRFKSSGRGRRATESAGERRRCIGKTEASIRPARSRRNQRHHNLDMAGVKTFDLLVGVVLVLQCVGTGQAEITTSNGKNLFS